MKIELYLSIYSIKYNIHHVNDSKQSAHSFINYTHSLNNLHKHMFILIHTPTDHTHNIEDIHNVNVNPRQL